MRRVIIHFSGRVCVAQGKDPPSCLCPNRCALRVSGTEDPFWRFQEMLGAIGDALNGSEVLSLQVEVKFECYQSCKFTPKAS